LLFFLNMVLILLILNFYFGSFCELDFSVQFPLSIQNSKLASRFFISNLVLILLIFIFVFWILLWNWIFILFYSSTFDLLGIGLHGCFHMGCFWFSNSTHKFEKLTWIVIFFFFCTYFFLFHLSTLFILKNSLRDFLQVFFNQVIPILWLVNKFGLLTQIFYWSFFIYLCSVLSFKISFFLTLRFIIFLVFISIRLSHSYDPANKVWKPYLYLQLFYFLGLFLLTIFFFISFYI
jgi:hypothetical protein